MLIIRLHQPSQTITHIARLRNIDVVHTRLQRRLLSDMVAWPFIVPPILAVTGINSRIAKVITMVETITMTTTNDYIHLLPK